MTTNCPIIPLIVKNCLILIRIYYKKIDIIANQSFRINEFEKQVNELKNEVLQLHSEVSNSNKYNNSGFPVLNNKLTVKKKREVVTPNSTVTSNNNINYE